MKTLYSEQKSSAILVEANTFSIQYHYYAPLQLFLIFKNLPYHYCPVQLFGMWQ